jgi:hypothetical protein
MAALDTYAASLSTAEDIIKLEAVHQSFLLLDQSAKRNGPPCGIPGPLESPALNCSRSPSFNQIEKNRFPNGPPLIRVSTRLNPRVLLQVSCGLPVARARHIRKLRRSFSGDSDGPPGLEVAEYGRRKIKPRGFSGGR